MEIAKRELRRKLAIEWRTTTKMTLIMELPARRSERYLTNREKVTTMTMMVIKSLKGPLALRMPGMQLKMMRKRRRRCERIKRRASKRGSRSISLRMAAAHQQTLTRTRTRVVSPLLIKM